MDGWTACYDTFTLNRNKYFEGAYCQGNGYLSVRATFEEGLDGYPQNREYRRQFKSVTTEKMQDEITKYGTFLPHVMGAHPELNEVIVNLPYFWDFHICCEGETFNQLTSKYTEFERKLCLGDGILSRTLIWQLSNGKRLRLKFRRFLSMANKHLAVLQVEMVALDECSEVMIGTGIDGDITTNGYRHFTELSFSQELPLVCEATVDTGTRIRMECQLDRDGSYVSTDKQARIHSTCILKPGQPVIVEKKIIVTSSRDEDKIGPENGLNKTFQELYEPHKEIWEKKWRQSDVVIKGDNSAQQAYRMAIYHLLRCRDTSSYRTSICAKGFAGEAYYGRYFWDTEIFMLPFYIYTDPEAARNLLRYRYETLDGARENARQAFMQGAKYPWHSGSDGTEQCSLWEYGELEVHVTADVAYGVCHYYEATGDWEFMRLYGLEILLETARYWMSRIDRLTDGRVGIVGVMGPDEYTAFNRNNAFTNRIVSFNLEAAARYLANFCRQEPTDYQEKARAWQLDPAELERFSTMAALLPIPLDEERKLLWQSEDFGQLAELSLADIWTDRSRPFAAHVTQDRLYRSKVLKQGDALMTLMLFPQEFSDAVKENTYRYYEPLTTHDSSLSPINHAIIAAWIDDGADVERFLDYALKLDFDAVCGNAQEGIHIANCGCLWQFLFLGVAGLSYAPEAGEPESVVLQSKSFYLPKRWESVQFPVLWRGQRYLVTVCNQGVEITMAEPETEGLE